VISLEAEERCRPGGESKVFDLNATLQAELFTSLRVSANPPLMFFFFFFVKSLDLLWENPGKHPKVWPRKP